MTPHPANLFLISAPRSGSTQLAAWLGSHPDICLSRIKESNYFSQHEFSPEYVQSSRINDIDPESYLRSRSKEQYNFAIVRTLEQYHYLFSNSTSQWRLDGSTTYLSCPESPELILKYNPDARFIILLRDPVERAVSHYRLRIRLGRTKDSLQQELLREIEGSTPLEDRFLIRPSLYAEPVSAYHKNIAPDKIRFLAFEEMIANQSGVVGGICDWLGIDRSKISFERIDRNAGAAPRFPALMRWMHQTGIKQWLRSKISYDRWQRMKRLTFSSSQQIDVSHAEKSLLQESLSVDVSKFRQDFPELASWWQQSGNQV